MGPIARVTASTVEVLEVLLSEDGPTWGLRIAKNTGRTPASIYPILNRLEGGGWLDATWESDPERPGPRRRLYQLTTHGRIEATRVTSEFRRRERRIAPIEPRLA
jgi:PadR family transcriptional regulator PadR